MQSPTDPTTAPKVRGWREMQFNDAMARRGAAGDEELHALVAVHLEGPGACERHQAATAALERATAALEAAERALVPSAATRRSLARKQAERGLRILDSVADADGHIVGDMDSLEAAAAAGTHDDVYPVALLRTFHATRNRASASRVSRSRPRGSRPRRRRTGSSSRTSGSDPGSDDPEPAEPSPPLLWRHPRFGARSTRMLAVLPATLREVRWGCDR